MAPSLSPDSAALQATDTQSVGKNAVLLLIDFQHDFLAPDGRMPVARSQVLPVLAAANRAVDYFRSAGLPIVAIGNEFRTRAFLINMFRHFATMAGSPGSAWDARLPINDVPYFPKWGGSAFINPALEPWLRERGVEEIVLTGLYARACVTATAKSALNRGFRVATIDAAIACASDKSRAKALARLHARGVAKVAIEDFHFG